MTDDVPDVLSEEARARIHAARYYGGMCARCGRALVADEVAWIEPVVVNPAGVIRWLAPLGRECASSAFLRETEGKSPKPCAVCGRGVYFRSTDPRRLATVCSRRCAGRWQKAQRRRS